MFYRYELKTKVSCWNWSRRYPTRDKAEDARRRSMYVGLEVGPVVECEAPAEA